MSERSHSEHSSAYTPNMDTPQGRKRAPRALWGLLLTLLLPPIGLVFLWRKAVFRTRGRLLLTALATVEMTLILAAALPRSVLRTDLPIPSIPSAATAAPEDEVVTVLSNIDQVLAAQQAAEGNPDGEAAATADPEAQAQYEAEQQAILQTKVYAVYSGAKLYHSKEVCGTQSNRRELTVEEAMAEGLGACPDCNPPVYTG